MDGILSLTQWSQPKCFWCRLDYLKTRTVFKLLPKIKELVNRPNIFNKNSCVISVLGYFYRFQLFRSIWIPSISLERLITLLKISTQITNKIPESGQPCPTPLFRLKCLLAKPLFKPQLNMLLYKTGIHCRNWGPKLKNSKAFLKVAPFNRIESFFKIKKDRYAWNVFLFSKGHHVCYDSDTLTYIASLYVSRLSQANNRG